MSEMGVEVRWQDEKSGQHGLILKNVMQMKVKVKIRDGWQEVLPVRLELEKENASFIDESESGDEILGAILGDKTRSLLSPA